MSNIKLNAKHIWVSNFKLNVGSSKFFWTVRKPYPSNNTEAKLAQQILTKEKKKNKKEK